MRAMWMPMELTLPMVLIVAVGVFLASFMDGIAGGGGIISVPTYFLVGAAMGTRLQLMVSERALQILLLAVLPVVAVVVLRQRKLPEEPGDIAPGRQAFIVLLAAFIVGAYDGFYGPGTGTFLILIFCTLGKLDVRTASGNVKLVNLSSNIGALATSLLHGKVFLALGLIGAVASVAGHWLGSGLAIKDGSKIVRPAILVVLVLLAIKVLTDIL